MPEGPAGDDEPGAEENDAPEAEGGDDAGADTSEARGVP